MSAAEAGDVRMLRRKPGESVWTSRFTEVLPLISPHIDSFNFFFDEGLAKAVDDLRSTTVEFPDSTTTIEYWFEDVYIDRPTKLDKKNFSTDDRLLPRECRERGLSYKGKLEVTLCVRMNREEEVTKIKRSLGHVPVMVRSAGCHLRHKTPDELAAMKEEAYELGGYFIVNGLERIIRMLQVPRRNYVMALIRSAFCKRGPEYTKYGCQIRCVRPDETSATLYLHYLTDGSANLRVSIRRAEFFVPALLFYKAFVDTSDREIYERLVGASGLQDTLLTQRVELLLRDSKRYGVYSRSEVRAFLGRTFRPVMEVPSTTPDETVGTLFLKQYVFVHLERDADKAALLLHMVRKLYALVKGDICEDNSDALCNHEILLGGHVYLAYFKEKLMEWQQGLKAVLLKESRVGNKTLDVALVKKCMDKVPLDIGSRMETMLSTGNLNTRTGMDLMQVSGYTILADKLNMSRYLSHFRCVHRGAFFATMKTTAVRKLLPESWGFLCPVHTPDGAPCGLLNHLASHCLVTNAPENFDPAELEKVLADLGVFPASMPLDCGGGPAEYGEYAAGGSGSEAEQEAPKKRKPKKKRRTEGQEAEDEEMPDAEPSAPPPKHRAPMRWLSVVLDGRVIGNLPPGRAAGLVAALRKMKVEEHKGVPATLEVAFLPPEKKAPYPGLYLFTTPSRMMRPVKHLASGKTELIGPLEQLYMSIACQPHEVRPSKDTHVEIKPTNILSVIANLTPFSDYNQSPRNMYQCQMGKQTMGTPLYAYPHRTDNKLYRLNTPQSPLVRTQTYTGLDMDSYPSGTNAVVAVISYTGYDMEDAMILNKSSYDRGFGHATVYTHQEIDLEEFRIRGMPITHHFTGRDPKDPNKLLAPDKIDADGLPFVGQPIRKGDPFYAYYDDTTQRAKIVEYKYNEPAFVEEVRVLGTNENEVQKVGVKLRFNRNPIVGDKFSSRHGQKGVMSQLWPDENMPFSESGIRPDVIINPHAFPSRMTIGMLIESMAGKAGALHGLWQDGTPFRFDEKQRAVDYFAEQVPGLPLGDAFSGAASTSFSFSRV
eukprot:tig00021348_g20541.t1